MFFVHLRDLSFIWPFREANTRIITIKKAFFFLNLKDLFIVKLEHKLILI